MNYISLAFTCLVIGLLLFYYLLPKKWNLQYMVLLLGSVIFYLSFNLQYAPFLLFTALSTFVCGHFVKNQLRSKLVLFLCIAANAAVWFAAKVLPWAITVSNSFLDTVGAGFRIGSVSILSAVGISYFTLQAIGYVLDVYKGKIAPEKNLLKYLLFLAYFPAIVQGPISRYQELAPQLTGQKHFSFASFRKGLILVAFGCVKKIVIADRLGIIVNAGFDTYRDLSGTVLYLVAVAYAIQLYMDFSGCVDICRGVSRLFGIELVNNFNRPYLATSIKEFWSKWHMSLSRWLRDYIYIPLGGNRRGTVRKYLNLLITFLVSGLWHGADFTFFVWGALHAIYQIVGQCTVNQRQKIKSLIGIEPGSTSERIYQTVLTFNLVVFAWIFFRAPSMADAVEYISRMFSTMTLRIGGIYELGVGAEMFPVLIAHLIAFFVVELRTKSQDHAVDGIVNLHLAIRWVVYFVLIFDVILFGAYGNGYDLSGFMYGGF